MSRALGGFPLITPNYEVLLDDVPLNKLAGPDEVRTFFATWHVEIPDVVFETLQPGVPFVIHLPAPPARALHVDDRGLVLARDPIRALTLRRLHPQPTTTGPPRRWA